MKLPRIVSKLITNKYVLYVVVFICLLHIFGYIMMGNMTAIILFVLVGLITANFSKNMVLVLAVPLVVTSSYVGGMFIKEGLENMSKDKKDSDAKAASTGVTDKSTDVPADTDIEKAKQQLDAKEKKPIVTDEPVGHDAKMKPQKNEKKGSYVDHAATLNEGYESLSKMLDGGAIQNLSDDTKTLAVHQKNLAKAMNNMGPIFENANKMLASINMEKLGSLGEMAKKLGVQKV
jgi:hypothetical protein